ncbi:hypothetical protein P4576_22725 [Peribacillus frigoritolerans]|nr:hypothetical protein [Peribacillus frigoritolerans]
MSEKLELAPATINIRVRTMSFIHGEKGGKGGRANSESLKFP